MTMAISYTYEHQWFIDTADGAEAPKYVRVTDDESFNPSNEDNKYSPKYKCNMTNPERITGRKTSIEFDIDIIADQGLQEWLIKHEDDINVPTSVVRVWGFPDGTSTAKKADFAMTESPIDGEAEGALKATGTLSMTSDGWTEGSFDENTGVFTPKAAPETPANVG